MERMEVIMNVCIIGWYGTETMGDIAILDGIFSIFSAIDKNVTFNIGSLYPFYTERTFYTEKDIFNISSPNSEKSIFSIKEKKQVDDAIKQADILAFGGGPLMDLEELCLMRYCFRKASACGIPSMVIGCGLGPNKSEKLISYIREIIELSQCVIFRDENSIDRAKELHMCNDNMSYIGDPAVISIENYKNSHCITKHINNEIVINFRSFPNEEYGKNTFFDVKICRHILINLASMYNKIILVPMHTFAIGGDDRKFYAEILKGESIPNVEVINHPQNLFELYKTYATAEACIGMRYHAVVMQTILNGNNYIFDYNDGAGNKTKGFMRFIQGGDFYKERIWNMNNTFKIDSLDCLKSGFAYEIENRNILFKYVDLIKKFIS